MNCRKIGGLAALLLSLSCMWGSIRLAEYETGKGYEGELPAAMMTVGMLGTAAGATLYAAGRGERSD